jgi:uncharacterized protein YjbI with pentapeptide repeats
MSAVNPISDARLEYDGHTFEGLVCQSEEITSKEFYGCVFTQCSFVEAVLSGCRFSDCTFKDCDLSLVRVAGCSFTNTRFERSRVMGVNWTEASWSGGGFLNSVDFFDCLISHSTFIGLSLRGVNIIGCIAKDVDFSEANLSQAKCTSTDFSESRFSHTDLTEADFTGATNYAIDATHNVLKKTRFSLPEAMSLLYSLDIILTE